MDEIMKSKRKRKRTREGTQFVTYVGITLNPTMAFTLDRLMQEFKRLIEGNALDMGYDASNYRIKYPIRLEPNEDNNLMFIAGVLVNKKVH